MDEEIKKKCQAGAPFLAVVSLFSSGFIPFLSGGVLFGGASETLYYI
jgi:hypothetical protein